MLYALFSRTEILCCAACLATLLIVVVLATKDHPPRGGRELVITFSGKWLARAPDDVRRLETAQDVRDRLKQGLLAICTKEYNSRFRDVISRIRRGV
jgi:hypothetical protein